MSRITAVLVCHPHHMHIAPYRIFLPYYSCGCVAHGIATSRELKFLRCRYTSTQYGYRGSEDKSDCRYNSTRPGLGREASDKASGFGPS